MRPSTPTQSSPGRFPTLPRRTGSKFPLQPCNPWRRPFLKTEAAQVVAGMKTNPSRALPRLKQHPAASPDPSRHGHRYQQCLTGGQFPSTTRRKTAPPRQGRSSLLLAIREHRASVRHWKPMTGGRNTHEGDPNPNPWTARHGAASWQSPGRTACPGHGPRPGTAGRAAPALCLHARAIQSAYKWQLDRLPERVTMVGKNGKPACYCKRPNMGRTTSCCGTLCHCRQHSLLRNKRSSFAEQGQITVGNNSAPCRTTKQVG